MTKHIPNQTLQNVIFRSYNPFTNKELVESIWLSLERKCPHSYFTSWGWISTWINSLPVESDIQFLVGYVGDEAAMALLVGSSGRRKYRILPTRVLSLNATSDPYFDKLFIEYNSILVDPTSSFTPEMVFDFLNLQNWDEFVLPGVSERFVSETNLLKSNPGPHMFVTIDEATNSYYVELQKIRNEHFNYLNLLSSNKRSQVRRSIKQYETEGKIQIREAANIDEALMMLKELADLHQLEWEKRGQTGAFSNQYLLQFHKDLIQNRFGNGEIQLLHIFNKNMTIGYLYNFVYQKNVLFYQSGFNYSDKNTYRPGLVSHYFAVLHNAEKNMETYDFLAGDSTYKSSLSTNSTPMYWIKLINGKYRFHLNKIMTRLSGNLQQQNN